MKSTNSAHIYVGLGTAIFIIGSVFLVRKLLTKKADFLKAEDRLGDQIDYSIFDSPDANGSGRCINRDLLIKLKHLEQRSGYPIFDWINSGVRTPYWNQKVGGVSNSSHAIPNCSAVDIKATTIDIRNTLVRVAKEVGFKRIGVGRTFVHLDVDRFKSQNVAWGYPSGTKPAINPFV